MTRICCNSLPCPFRIFIISAYVLHDHLQRGADLVLRHSVPYLLFPFYACQCSTYLALPSIYLLYYVTDGRRNARSANQVLRRFMQDLLQTVSNRYVEFVSSEWRGTLSDFRLERQLSLQKRRIARWYFSHP